MSRRERPKPGPTSNIAAAAAAAGAMPPPGALAGQVPLVPGSGLVSRGQQQGQEPEQPAPTATADEPTVPKPARQPAGKRGGQGGRRSAPAVSSAVALTVRLDPDEATDVDHFVLTLREQARRTRLDKSEVLRELLRLAQEHEPTRKALLRRIT